MMQESPYSHQKDEDDKERNKKCCILLHKGIFVAAAAVFIAGLLVGHFGIPRGSMPTTNNAKPDGKGTGGKGTGGKSTGGQQPDIPISQVIHDGIKTQNLRKNLIYLSGRPHLAGTPGDERLTKYIVKTWKNQGLDNVKQYWYNVLLSYPDSDSPNQVSLLDSNGTVKFTSQLKEKSLKDGSNTTDVIPPFNSYSPSGDVEGTLIFVNYGRVEDFMLLKSNYSVNFTGKIVIAKYGKIYRGNKVELAAQHGAAGIILYSDPADYAPFPSIPVYPDSWWFPPTGVQRGTIYLDVGDPETPGYPSIDTAYRLPEDQTALPKIPCHSIGYGDAKPLLSRMTGPEVPPDWKGTIRGITYRLGPGLNETGWKVRLHVSTKNRLVNTSNVIGYIEGSLEPDRYVLVGNHRDAWGFGAVDASSGTMVLMELARVFSGMAKKGWRPRRTLIFCSWGAEEYGLIGSYEWVENFVSILTQRAVTYINVDISVLGNNSLNVAGYPLLYDVIYQASQKVETPNRAGQSLYDEWKIAYPKNGTNLPRIRALGRGSDYAAFASFAGIPSIDLSYWYDSKLNIGFYPIYHSVYETFYAYEKFIDPKFKYAQAIGRYVGEMLRNLAFSPLLPFNVQTYGEELVAAVSNFEAAEGALLQTRNISLGPLKKAAQKFKEATKAFQKRRKNISEDDYRAVRTYNDQLMQLERIFVSPSGLPGRLNERHTLLAPSSKDLYSGAIFPGITDLLFDIKNTSNTDELWEKLKKHLAEIIFYVKVATSSLSPFINM